MYVLVIVCSSNNIYSILHITYAVSIYTKTYRHISYELIMVSYKHSIHLMVISF